MVGEYSYVRVNNCEYSYVRDISTCHHGEYSYVRVNYGEYSYVILAHVTMVSIVM